MFCLACGRAACRCGEPSGKRCPSHGEMSIATVFSWTGKQWHTWEIAVCRECSHIRTIKQNQGNPRSQNRKTL